MVVDIRGDHSTVGVGHLNARAMCSSCSTDHGRGYMYVVHACRARSLCAPVRGAPCPGRKARTTALASQTDLGLEVIFLFIFSSSGSSLS